MQGSRHRAKLLLVINFLSAFFLAIGSDVDVNVVGDVDVDVDVVGNLLHVRIGPESFILLIVVGRCLHRDFLK